MAKFDVRQQETRPGIRKATGADLGAVEGRAKQNLAAGAADLGGTILAIEQRKRTREETIERVRSLNSFSQTAEQELTRLSTEEDLSSTEVLKSYNAFLKDNLNSALEGHSGSNDSKAELTRQLEAQQGTYAQGAYKDSVSAQFKLISSHLDGSMATIADQTTQLPSAFLENINRWNSEVSKMGPALRPDQEEAYYNAGVERITASAVQSYLNDGETDAARAILDTPGISDKVAPANMLRFRQSILTRERATEKGELAGQNALKKAAAIMGIPVDQLTPAQRTKIAGLTPTAGAKTLQQKVADFTSVVGREPTEGEMTKMAGAHIEEETGVHGNSLDGRSLDIMKDLSSGFAGGLLSEQDRNTYINAVTDYTQPRQVFDQTTGQTVLRQNRAPAYVEVAFERAGIPLPGADKAAAGSGTPGATGDDKFSFENDPVGEGVPTVWERRKNIVGMAASAKQTLGRMPFGVGDLLSGGEGPSVEEDRQYVDLRQKTLTTALQNSPRFAETEREFLNEAFNISGTAWDSDAAYRSRTMAIDDYLGEEIKRATKDLDPSSTTTTAIRQAAIKDLANLSHFQMILGVPPRIKTRADLKKYAPGSQVIIPSGEIVIVPEGDSTEAAK